MNEGLIKSYQLMNCTFRLRNLISLLEQDEPKLTSALSSIILNTRQLNFTKSETTIANLHQIMSCLRDATELTNNDLLCTFITCSLTVCYVPLKFLDSTSR